MMANNPKFNQEHWFEQITEPILWHYTSVDVLKNLARPDGQLYATHSCELTGDCSELYYGRELWDETLETFGWPPKDKAHIVPYVENSPCLEAFKKNCFVFCMTTLGDSKFHWDNYAPKENGIAIGFATSKLKDRLKQFITQLPSPKRLNVIAISSADVFYQAHLDYCVYESEQAKDYYHELIHHILADDQNHDDFILQCLQLGYIREAVIPFAKRECFDQEKEIRLFYSGPDLCCRNAAQLGGKMRVPLFRCADLIDQVMISPYGSKDEVFRCLYDFKKENSLLFSICASKPFSHSS